jgi:hypothetical protein
MLTSVYALAATDLQANAILVALGELGFLVDDISVLLPEAQLGRLIVHEPMRPPSKPASSGRGGGGSATGPVIEGALGWITGISRVTIPGLGHFIAAGPIKALLNGTVLGAIDGGLAGSLTGLGLPAGEARRYEGCIRDGRILLVAHSDKSARIAKARQALQEAGAEDIGCSSDGASPQAPATDGAVPPADGPPAAVPSAPLPRAAGHG